MTQISEKVLLLPVNSGITTPYPTGCILIQLKLEAKLL